MNNPAVADRAPSRRIRLPAALRRRWRPLRMVALVLLGLLVLHATGLLEAAGLRLYDQFNRWIAVPGQSEVAVVVGFAESDFAHYPQYPFSDALLAEVLDRVAEAQPAAILLAVLRDVPVEPGHEALLERYRRLDRLYGVSVWRAGRGDSVPAPPVLRETKRHGTLPALHDDDGRIRRLVLASRDGEQRVESVLLRILSDLLADSATPVWLDEQDRLWIGGRRIAPIGPGFGDYRGHAVFPGDLVWMLPLRRDRAVASISFHELLEGRHDPELLRGRLVVIGPTALSIRPGLNTALNPPERGVVSAVESFAWTFDALHAAATLGWPVLRSPPPWLQWLGLVALAWAFCAGFLRDATVARALLRGGLGMLAVLLVGYLCFRLGWWLPVAAALATVLLSGLVAVDNVIRAESKQRHLLGVLRRVFECLPDPILVVDGTQRIRLSNEAMRRLAAAGPDELDGLALARLLPGAALEAPAGGVVERPFEALSGERMRVRLRLPEPRAAAPAEMRVVIVEAVHPADQSRSPPAAAVFEHRLQRAQARAQRQQAPLTLFWLGVADPELVTELCGPAALADLSAALAQRIRQVFPASEYVLDVGDGTLWWLPVALSPPAPVCRQLAEALAWPLDVAAAVEAVDLKLAMRDGLRARADALPDALRAAAVEFASLRLSSAAATP